MSCVSDSVDYLWLVIDSKKDLGRFNKKYDVTLKGLFLVYLRKKNLLKSPYDNGNIMNISSLLEKGYIKRKLIL